jgi:tRNA dimethylallyltransferase
MERMWRQGFTAEVERLLGQGLRQGRTASRAIGYRQLIAYFDGQLSEVEAKEQTIIRTRQFSRKQLAWFRRDPRIVWLAAGGAALPELVARVRDLSQAAGSLG